MRIEEASREVRQRLTEFENEVLDAVDRLHSDTGLTPYWLECPKNDEGQRFVEASYNVDFKTVSHDFDDDTAIDAELIDESAL